MKSFKEYIAEGMTDARTIHRTSTVDMAPLYKLLYFGARKDKMSNIPTWKKVKKILGVEFKKRADAGDELAKKVLNNKK
jgi:hypothetical protein